MENEEGKLLKTGLKRIIALATVLAMSVMLLAGCGGSSGGEDTGKTGSSYCTTNEWVSNNFCQELGDEREASQCLDNITITYLSSGVHDCQEGTGYTVFKCFPNSIRESVEVEDDCEDDTDDQCEIYGP